MRDPFQPVSPREADKRALRWQKDLDSTAMVGKRHHIVPHFLLSRFSDANDRLQVRDRTSGNMTLRNAADLAVTDFYTFIDLNGKPDSSFESLLGVVEGEAAQVIRTHLDRGAFARDRSLSSKERLALDALVGFQVTRGMRNRRAMEVVADYQVKLLHQAEIEPEDIEATEFVPHQNDHIKYLAHLSEQVTEHLRHRPATILKLSRPLLLISDEPAVMTTPDGWVASPPRTPNGHPNISGLGVRREDVIQISNLAGPGLANAEEVALPLSPCAVVVYGRPNSSGPIPTQRLSDAQSIGLARELNPLMVSSAVDWVAAHPAHADLASMPWVAPKPFVRITDGGTMMGVHANQSARRRPHRLRK